MNSASVLRQEGLSNAGRTEEDERANRSTRVLEIGTRAAERLADSDNRFILTNHLALEFALHGERASASPACSMRESGTPVHLETTCMISSSVTRTSFSSLLIRHSERIVLEAILGLFLTVTQGGRFLEILRLDGSFLIDADLLRSAPRYPSHWADASSPRCARAIPASSITSMALSGRKRPVR